MKKEYIAPLCKVIECEMLPIMDASTGNITINKDPYEGELNSKGYNSGFWNNDVKDDNSLWDN